MTLEIRRRAVAEAIGTALLVATVVGSGIMAQRLAGGNVALALLANTLATGAALIALILTFGGISGAHFNPAVTFGEALSGRFRWREVPVYVAAQGLGAIGGVILANLMFGLPAVTLSVHARNGSSLYLSEFVATFGLLWVMWGTSRARASAVPLAVGAYITAAYWFTASTAFANPAVTLARAFSNTFAGIQLADVPGFIVAQIAATLVAAWLFAWIVRSPEREAKQQQATGPELLAAS